MKITTQRHKDTKTQEENKKTILLGRRPMSCVLCLVSCVLCLCACLCVSSLSWADDKAWTAVGDASNWFDDANWLPAGAPTASDDTTINMLNASVDLPQAFEVKSITLGGKKPSSLTVSNFAVGTVAPENSTDLAVYNRRDGRMVLKGSAGKITLKGAYKDSEVVIPDEPSFMFYVQ